MAFPRALIAGNDPTETETLGANRATVQVLWRQGDGYSAERLCSSSLTIWGPRTLAGLRPRLDEVRSFEGAREARLWTGIAAA